MVVSAVYALIFLDLAVLSIVVLLISRGHSSTYKSLHLSLLVAFIHSGVSFSLPIVAANGAASPGLFEGLDVFASFVSFCHSHFSSSHSALSFETDLMQSTHLSMVQWGPSPSVWSARTTVSSVCFLYLGRQQLHFSQFTAILRHSEWNPVARPIQILKMISRNGSMRTRVYITLLSRFCP